MKQIEVVAAIIHDDEGRIFATQRGYGDYKDGWEFPGGKMEPGETPEDALKREIWEELETKIVVERLVQTAFRLVMNSLANTHTSSHFSPNRVPVPLAVMSMLAVVLESLHRMLSMAVMRCYMRMVPCW